MSCLKKFVRWLKNPRGHAVWITYLLTALFVAARLAPLMIMPEGGGGGGGRGPSCAVGCVFLVFVRI